MSVKRDATIDREHVTQRVEDWKKRVSQLYDTVDGWLSDYPEYKIVPGQTITMFEELMHLFDVYPEKIKTADIFKEKELVMTFKPRGLWVVGANGRIDLISNKGSYILIDYSDQFQNPKWHICTSKDRENGKVFTKQELLNILLAESES